MYGREAGKIEKYKMVTDEISRMWCIEKATVNPVGVGATGFEKHFAAVAIETKVAHAQETVLLRTVKILKLALRCKKRNKQEKQRRRCHCARLYEIFDNNLLCALTKLDRATNSKRSQRKINKQSNNKLIKIFAMLNNGENKNDICLFNKNDIYLSIGLMMENIQKAFA